MDAIRMRVRSELHTRLAGVVVLALIAGVIGGVVIAAAAGARRTASAYPRFLKAENALDAVVKVVGPQPALVRKVAHEIQHLPLVKDSALVVQGQGHLRIPGRKTPGNIFPIVSLDGRVGATVNRPKILAGRMLNQAATDELFPSVAIADDLGLHVGETVQLAYGGLFSNVGRLPPNAPAPVTMRIVGIGAMPSMFQPLAGGYLPGVLVSSGFARAHPDFLPGNLGVPLEWDVVTTLHGGPASVAKLQSILADIKAKLPHGYGVGIPFTQASQTGGVEQTTHAEAVALWILAALIALAGLAIFAQALARQTFLESVEYPTLRSLGMSPTQLFTVGMIRTSVIGLLAAVVAVVVGFLLSPLTPTGVARIAEPSPGFAFDGTVVAVAAVAVVVLSLLIGALPAWRAASAPWTAAGTRTTQRLGRRSAMARAVETLSPSGRAGVRMALDPGAGRTAVPVRTTVFGAAITLVALAASLAFSASLNKLETTPALSGRTWSSLVFARGDSHTPGTDANRLAAFLDRSPAVSGYAIGGILGTRIANSTATSNVLTEALDPQRGDVGPALIEGRAPEASDEIALGTQTMQEAGAHIGGTVVLTTKGGPQRMRVVGRIAMPNLFFSFTRPGEGAAITLEAAHRIAPKQTTGGTGMFIKLVPGPGGQAFLTEVHRTIPHLFVVPTTQSAQLSSLNELGRFPLILAGILALMAVATLAHTLLTSIRRRRHDLAILKTLGFVRGQVSATVAWQATTFGALAVLIGIPIGIVAGRWGWNVFADHLGVVPDAVLPGILLLIIAPATVVVANLLAVVPGRIASRLRPATVLRTE
jgi:hypothetical protein